MLKSCWECIGGYDLVRDRITVEDRYGTQMNGDSNRAPPWPQDNVENMFLLPRKLAPLDSITIEGEIQQNPRIITASLLTANFNNLPDYNNIACQIEMNFPGNSDNQNKLFVKIIQDGNAEVVENDDEMYTSQYVTDTNLKVTFMPRSNGNGILEMFLGDTYLQAIKLKHDLSNIRYIDLKGDIEKVNNLDFKFA